MRFAALALLVAAACEAAPRVYDRSCDVASRRSDRGGVACSAEYATGSAAAIASYASAPCECVQVSRACSVPSNGILINERGAETLSGDPSPEYAYCTKGSRTSLHAGDLVGCLANLPRIQPANADGTGALSVLSEGRRVNYTLYSSGFDDSSWNPTGVNVAAPTIIANAAIAPDGTMTADMVCFAATTAADLSELFSKWSAQQSGCPVAANSDGGNLTASVYAAGALDGGFRVDGGSIDLATYTGAAWENSIHVVQPYLATGAPDGGASGWTRLVHANYAQDSSAVGYFLIGNASLINGGVARPAQCIYLAKAQCELGATVTSPVDTISRQALAYADTVSVQEPVCRDANARTAWLGDSLSGLDTVGEASTLLSARPPAVYASATSRTVDNWAHNGDKVADAILQWSSYGDRTRAQRIVFWAGINDIIGDSANGTTLAGTVTAWVALRAAESKFVTVVGLAPCKAYSGWTAGKQTQLLAFNTALSTYCGANPTQCVYVDVYSTLTDGSDNLNPAYEAPDHLHFNQAGATAAGNRVASVSP